MYHLKDGNITLTMTVREYLRLLHVFGYAIHTACGHGELALAEDWAELSNDLSQGNPRYRPYPATQEVGQ